MTLTARFTVGGVEQAVNIPYVAKKARYEVTLSGISAPNPAVVVVESSGGGSDSRAINIK